MGDMVGEENKSEFLREQQMLLSETDPILNSFLSFTVCFWGSA